MVDWQIQPVSIQTRWIKDVIANHPLSEYPRPQMIRDNNWQNLNGLWNYTITNKDALKPADYQSHILVPYPIESALSGVKKSLQPTEALWYQRFFKVDIKKKQKVLLHFGAVDWQATVYVNGKKIGSHSGGYTAFSFDITSVIKSGSNELVVKVYDPTDQGIGPHGKQVLNPGNIYYTSSSGIWQTVWLEIVADDYIEKLTLTPDIDKNTLNAVIKAPEGCDIHLIASESGKPISIAKGKTRSVIKLPIKDPKLWSPDSPFLYDLQVKLVKKGKVIDQVKSYFGMRKISIGKDSKGIDRIFLNNQYYYNLGTLDQGFWPEGLYTAPTDSALQFDIMAIKAMGFNTIRKHIKVEPARWYYYTDKLGMLVWQDMVPPNQKLPDGSKKEFEKGNIEILDQLHNFPSIITWVLFNEKWGQYDQKRLTQWIKQTDPTRLTNGHSGECLYVNNQLRSPSPDAYIGADMTDVHSYPNPMLSTKQQGKAQVCGEFGGIGVRIEGHLWDDLTVGWGYDGIVTPSIMLKQYARMIDSLKFLESKGLSASIYTQPFDVESEQNGFFTYDRMIIKLPISTIRSIHAKLWPATANYMTTTKGFSANVADSSQRDYTSRLQEYNEGYKDSMSLRWLTVMAEKEKDKNLSKKVSNEYLRLIKDPFSPINLKFIQRYTRSTNDYGFQFLLNNTTRVNSVLGKHVAESIIIFAIENDEIKPSYRQQEKNINWDLITQKVISKYGEWGREAMYQSQVLYAVNKNDWNLFKAVAKSWFQYYGANRNWITKGLLNNIAWRTFKNVNDHETLSTALEMSKKSISGNADARFLDTYSNLLYKLGRRREAIIWEEKAVILDPGNVAFKETLSKMSLNQPTW